jgi:hypothetical protein
LIIGWRWLVRLAEDEGETTEEIAVSIAVVGSRTRPGVQVHKRDHKIEEQKSAHGEQKDIHSRSVIEP